MVRFSGRELLVAFPPSKKFKGTRYLNALVRGLKKAKYSIGSLLGEDDHAAANAKPEWRKHFMIL